MTEAVLKTASHLVIPETLVSTDKFNSAVINPKSIVLRKHTSIILYLTPWIRVVSEGRTLQNLENK